MADPTLLGLGAALLVPTALVRLQPPRGVLTVYSSSHLEAGWASSLGLFYSVSARLIDDGFSRVGNWPQMMGVLAEAQAAGCVREGWGAHACKTVDSAMAEGVAAASAAVDARVKAYYWNAEVAWGGSSSNQGASDPVGTSIAFADAFHANAPGVLLAWNAFTTETARLFGSPHPVLDVPANVSRFDRWSPMVYGTTAATIANKWRTRVSSWGLRLPRWPMVGTGRPGGGGQFWGYYSAEPGLVQLVGQTRPEGVCYFYGNHSAGMLTSGDARNPPLGMQLGGLKGRRLWS